MVDYFLTNCEPVEAKVGGQTSHKTTKHRETLTRWALPGDWVPSFISNYINLANEQLFEYDITALHHMETHMLEYGVGHYYHWHVDDDINSHLQYASPPFGVARQNITEYVRKLSFSLQLTDPSEYTGGDVQIIDDTILEKMVTIPKERGTLCIFDSRTRHRVKPVKTGKRFVLVGWVLGPRWK
jgi:PKHD-type hydroxylase